ncbi:nitronate monooxygenase [Arthrobacter sp. zg-ZUI100]|uniref:nitronate monooxygenase n=1 Tax=Arthrobacter jiangjiafuii TaxID=2817475 RepID=UPI001AEEB6D2|nr:nitronate monooxygenase [Arthrobacter jiangjiafuii]MBP3036114.1 nitronate monooxygenase [Arthrobacter jiangjiafuii]
MFNLHSLRLPVIGAPMAGGASTPQLAAAVSNAGGLGFLAAGYKSAAAVAEQTARTRSLAGGPFGVNLFVPDAANTYAATSEEQQAGKLAAALAYRDVLAAGAGAEPGFPDPEDDDGWAAKLDLVLRERIPVVSFTFGLPEKAVLAALAGRGICTVLTVTDADEARAAAGAGASALCVQGPDAGGHRGTLESAKAPGAASLGELLHSVRDTCALPVIAAGGIGTAADAAAALAAGAVAVQVGTALLLSTEAGTGSVHRAALKDAAAGRRAGETALTRAFSGRPARGLLNRFMLEHPDAPDAYPYINQITGPLRAAAAAQGDQEGISLWAGTGYRRAAEEPAEAIVRRLAGEAPGESAGKTAAGTDG